jgi:hypothetical protein
VLLALRREGFDPAWERVESADRVDERDAYRLAAIVHLSEDATIGKTLEGVVVRRHDDEIPY